MMLTEEELAIQRQWSEEERGEMSNMAAAMDASQQIPALLETIGELRERMDFTYCAYCGKLYKVTGEDPDFVQALIDKHIMECPKHPMATLNAEFKRLQNLLIEVSEHIPPGQLPEELEQRFMDSIRTPVQRAIDVARGVLKP